MIRLTNISMDYTLHENRIEVLSGVDLTIANGERIAVVGPSGSGKTTLLLLLAGLERPSSGSVCIAETALETLDADQLADLRRDHIGIVFQSFHLIPSLTALENVAMPLWIRRMPRPEAEQVALKMLGQVGLAERARHRPAELSGGERQRVAIARALVTRPACVLADEPTGNLDRATADGVYALMLQLAREHGTAFVLVTHDDQLAARCGRALRLERGRLAGA